MWQLLITWGHCSEKQLDSQRGGPATHTNNGGGERNQRMAVLGETWEWGGKGGKVKDRKKEGGK